MIKNKNITERSYTQEIISPWIQPEGYNIKFVDITNHTFPISIGLFYGDLKEFKRYIKDKYDHTVEVESCEALYDDFLKDGVMHHLVLIQNNTWHPHDYGTIAHELLHATFNSLKHIGLKHCEDSEEAYTYMLGNLMELTIRAFVELKAPVRKKRKKK